jgi:hypothetical protein
MDIWLKKSNYTYVSHGFDTLAIIEIKMPKVCLHVDSSKKIPQLVNLYVEPSDIKLATS